MENVPPPRILLSSRLGGSGHSESLSMDAASLTRLPIPITSLNATEGPLSESLLRSVSLFSPR